MKAFGSARFCGAIVAVLAAGLAAGAQGPGDGPGRGFGPGVVGHRPPMEQLLGPRGAEGRWWNNPAVIEKLKLTDDQRKAMDQILLKHRETLIDMRANVEKAELGMEPLMHEDQPNEAKILAQIDKVAQARAELEKANARFLLALRAKLTPDQWKALQEARHERMQRMDHGDWRRNHPSPDGHGPRQAPPAPGVPPGPQGMLRYAPDWQPGPDLAMAFIPEAIE